MANRFRLPTFLALLTFAFGGAAFAQSNTAPRISGTPSTIGTPGKKYEFQPRASDREGHRLTFSIRNKPTWAGFDITTGKLWGTPRATVRDIVITVTDSRGASASLPPFTINVGTTPSPAPTPAPRTATLRWQAPALYTDGRALGSGEIGAYLIYQGNSAGALRRVAEVDARTLLFTVNNLATGTHYFAVAAVSTDGVESGLSAVRSKTVL